MKRIAFLCLIHLVLIPIASAAPTYSITAIGLDDPEHTRSDGFKNSTAKFFHESGTVVGHSSRYSGMINRGQSAWLFDGSNTVRIGLTDLEHTRSNGHKASTVYRVNKAGMANGVSNRYNGSNSELGESAWLYDGSSTIRLGFVDGEHTSDDGHQVSGAGLNEAGHVVGFSRRYKGNETWGQTLWLYDGTNTIELGLQGPGYIASEGPIDGYKYSGSAWLNEAGQVTGETYRYSGGTLMGFSAWLYDGGTTTGIGLTDSEHTRNDGYQWSYVGELYENGQALGGSIRYNGGAAERGHSAWLYDGTKTIKIGPSGSENTRSDGHQYIAGGPRNKAGQILGVAARYGGASDLGSAVWLYDGTTTTVIGPTGKEFTRSDGYQRSEAYQLNDAGMVAGWSYRYRPGSTDSDKAAWLYDGTKTIEIGLTGAEHTNINGEKANDIRALNQAGQVTGLAARHNGGSPLANLGSSNWLYNGTTTIDIGLTGPEHTRSDGYKDSVNYNYDQLNEAGQVIGVSQRYNGGPTNLGQDAWLYDPVLGTIPLQLSKRSDGYAYSTAAYFGQDGLVLGTYTLFDAQDKDLGSRAFYFTIADGLHDLGTMVKAGLSTAGWERLASIFQSNDRGQILGHGRLTSQSGGQIVYLLTPIVPEPSSRSLGLLVFTSLVFVRRRPPAQIRNNYRSIVSHSRLRNFAGLRVIAILTAQRKDQPMNRLVFLCLAAAVTVCNVRTAAADIYQWEFDPACSCYKPSTVLAPDGAGASAAPSANLSNRNLTKAYLHLADLSESNLSNTNLTQVLATRALFINANLTNANLQQGNLERAYFVGANLTGANFADADVRHATFFRNSASPGTSISTNQFYSTASYQAHNLTGVTFTGDFSGWNFANQNLNGATFDFATNVTGASFAGAQIQGTFFGHETISAAQLYTTASYQARNLSGIRFDLANLSGWNFSQQNLTGATFIQNTLTNTDFRDANLSNAGISAYWLDADFRRANLTNALLQAVSGTDAILTDAKVTGAALYGITLAQLYSTASYQANDLGAIKLYADLTDADFSGRTLSNAAFNSKLTNANFSNADLTNADFTSSVLTGANFFQANLSGANFYAADLTGANFTNANVDGADFARYIPVGDNHPTCGFCSGPGVPRGGINLQQIYSSASYQSGDLSGIRLEYNNLVGADFAGINLSGAVLIGASLIDANLTNANVSGVDIALTAIHGVDARGAQSFNLPNLPDVVFNTIEADGHIEGVTLTDSTSLAYRRLLIRDYDGDPSRNIGPISIQVEEHFDMSAGGKLQMRFEADAWNSTISFNSGIPVSLGGTLELSFVEGVSLAGQVGRTFDVFDWTGVTPTGTFTVESAYVWELTNLYTTGEVTLLAIPGLPGDFNQDGAVDAADCIVWRKNPGGIYTEDDYNTWRASYGRVVIGSAESQTPVPEPEATFLLVLGAVTGFWSLRPIIFARSNTSVRVTRGNKRPKYKLLAYGTSTWSHNSVRLERRRSPAGANPILPIGRSGDINRSDKAVATSEGKNVAGRS